MKKALLFTIVLLVAIPTIYKAQLIRGFGLKAGATITNQDWDYTGNFENNLNRKIERDLISAYLRNY